MREQPVWPEASSDSGKKLTHANSQSSLSAREAAWLFARNPQRLRLAKVVKLDHVRRSDEEWETAYQLAQDFRVMVTRRQHNFLDRWLTEAWPQVLYETSMLCGPSCFSPTAMGKPRAR
jgi:hypothetical protein